VRPPRPGPIESSYSRSGVRTAILEEFRRVLADRTSFGLIVLAPVIYGLLYPQPYLGQCSAAYPSRSWIRIKL